MKLIDFKEKEVIYNWITIYVGIIENFLEAKVISDYAVELIEKGNNDNFIAELVWGVETSEVLKNLIELKTKYFPDLEEKSNTYNLEKQKLRFVYLSKLNDSIKKEDELLNKITEFYNNNDYPEDMIRFINYMPQDGETNKKDLLKEFYSFLNLEECRIKKNH